MLFLLASLPTAAALTPSGRWGHRAVYVEDKQTMYVVGGEVSGAGTQITNEVLVLPLNSTSADWSLGPNSGLPPHAFGSMALSGSNLVVIGGMTSSCSSDAVAHSLDLGGSTWTSGNPGSLRRRRGAAAAPDGDKVMLIGGISDKNTCGNSATAYTAYDDISLPVSSGSVTTKSLPMDLTGTNMAVSDFGLAQAGKALYLVGGQSSDGTLVRMDTIGVYSGGTWNSKRAKGDVPSGRLGATLAAHPSASALILYGGSEYDSSTKKYTPSSKVSVLNTTTWEWSTPSNLQPASSAAVAYHTSVMTPSGVMISAFGMGVGGSPVNTINYLDMRDASPASWSWQSNWSSSMLGDNAATHSDGATTKKHHNGVVAAAVVPAVIGAFILTIAGMWFWRRHQRNVRQRRLASHYAFNSDEDEGRFRRGDSYDGGRRTKVVYPFGRDANEKEGTWTSDVRDRIVKVFRRNSAPHGVGDDGTIVSREMAQISRSEMEEKGMRWEEIDFGLGRVDEERREATYTDLPRRAVPRASLPRQDGFTAEGSPPPEVYNMPVASTYYPEPETIEPATGELISIDDGSPRKVEQNLAEPAADTSLAAAAADAAAADASLADWNLLERSLNERPAFRAISPSATLGSHHHDIPSSPIRSSSSNNSHSSSGSYSTAPSIPPLDFNTSPVAPKRDSVNKRHSMGPTVRAVSGPVTRQLAGGRRLPSTPSAGSHSRRASTNALGIQANPRPVVSRLRVVNADQEE